MRQNRLAYRNPQPPAASPQPNPSEKQLILIDS